MKNIRLLLLLLICIITTTARADFNDGVVAYLMADYEKAFKTMQSLAETSDHGYAQYYMGMMYLKGQGVEQDYKAASDWFRKASEKNIAQAQYKLGNLNITPSFTPGLYNQGNGKDLGHALEFKSEIQLSLELPKDSQFGFSYNHLSNASLGDKNPGANSYMFNLLKKF